jgi:hypothetical protein
MDLSEPERFVCAYGRFGYRQLIMSTVEEITEALHGLPTEQRWGVLHRFSDELWSDWDEQIESDLKSGRLNSLLAEAKADILAGRTRNLNEVLDNA